jgi:oligogalacturonide transport system substrate-binding protein
MVKRFRSILALSLAAVTVLSLTACSGKSGTAGTSSVAVGSRTASLRFSWWGGDARAKATLDVIKQFETKYPKITIEGEYGSSDGYNDKLATQLAAGTAPDVIQVGTGYLPTYVKSSKSYFVDFLKYKIDLTGFDKDFLKANGNFSGKQYGLPTGITGYCMIENSTLAQKIGIDLTKQYTWDDLITMGQKVQAYDKSDYLVASNTITVFSEILKPYLRQITGNSLLLDDTKKLGVTQEQLTEGFTLVKKLYDNNVVAPASHMSAYEKDNIQKDPYWINGKYVSVYCVSSTATVLTAANTNAQYSAAKMAVVKDAKTNGYFTDCPQYMCVSAKSKYIPEAVAFLDYFYNDKTAAKTLGVQRSIPPTKTARDICKDAGLIDAITQGTVDVSLSYKGKSDSGYSTASEVETIVCDAISQVAYGKKTPSAAASSTITQLQTYLSSQK